MTFDTNWHYVVVTSPAGNSSFANASVYIDGVQQVLSSSSGSKHRQLKCRTRNDGWYQ